MRENRGGEGQKGGEGKRRGEGEDGERTRTNKGKERVLEKVEVDEDGEMVVAKLDV